MYLWLYLVFFNMLWVWLPAWILYEAYQGLNGAIEGSWEKRALVEPSRKKK